MIAVITLISPLFAGAQISGGNTNTGSGVSVPTSLIYPPTPCPTIMPMRLGSSGAEIKALQSRLAEDASIYPEKLTTGYYGQKTTEAIKRLQTQLSLPQTGIVDDQIRDYLFPCISLRVVAPNGGEAWRVGETQVVEWQTDQLYTIQNFLDTLPQTVPGSSGSAPRGTALTPQDSLAYPLYPSLSIDLIRTDIGSNPVVYHIGNAYLNGDRSIKWTVPSGIPDSKNYKVRVSVGGRAYAQIYCVRAPCPQATPIYYPPGWSGRLWDESDGVFSITGGTPNPPPGVDLLKLSELRRRLTEVSTQLQKIVALLNEIIGDATVASSGAQSAQ